VDGELQEIVEGMQLPRYKVHTVELVIDRLTVDPTGRKRLTESVEAAIHLGEGGVNALIETSPEQWKDVYYSTSYSCPSCGTSYETPAPNMFSFNSPFGACTTCEGLGEMLDFDLSLVIPDPTVSIARGGIGPLGKKRDTWLWKQVTSFCQHANIDVNVPIGELTDAELEAVLYGTDGSAVSVQYGDTAVKHRYLGVLPSLRHQYEQSTTSTLRKSIERYFASTACRSCGGARLKQEHLHIRIADVNIHFCTQLDIASAVQWFSDLSTHLTDRPRIIAHHDTTAVLTRCWPGLSHPRPVRTNTLRR
jgi:excinuclease ABC subunit A